MELHGHWRHELKYQIGPAAHLALRQRLRTVMEPDPHAGADGLQILPCRDGLDGFFIALMRRKA